MPGVVTMMFGPEPHAPMHPLGRASMPTYEHRSSRSESVACDPPHEVHTLIEADAAAMVVGSATSSSAIKCCYSINRQRLATKFL